MFSHLVIYTLNILNRPFCVGLEMTVNKVLEIKINTHYFLIRIQIVTTALPQSILTAFPSKMGLLSSYKIIGYELLSLWTFLKV